MAPAGAVFQGCATEDKATGPATGSATGPSGKDAAAIAEDEKGADLNADGSLAHPDNAVGAEEGRRRNYLPAMSPLRSLEIIPADYADPQHQDLIPRLLDAYARDPLGGGEPLPEEVKARLVGELRKLPNAISLLGFCEGHPAGLVNAFFGFSTFRARPLLNIHDMIVLPEYRGLGLSQLLLDAAETLARAKGCCKLTLEVQSGNEVAMGAYRKFGFSGYELDPRHGQAMFWQKWLAHI